MAAPKAHANAQQTDLPLRARRKRLRVLLRRRDEFDLRV
jgi:hypothetical protein